VRKLNEAADDDAVAEVGRSLRVRSTIYCRSRLRAPWGFGVRSGGVSAFHVVAAGECWLEADGADEPVRLTAGDLVVLMTGRCHRVRDDPGSEVKWLDDILAGTPKVDGRLRYGGSGVLTDLLCGGFVVEGAEASPVVRAMPPVLHVPAHDPAMNEWLSSFLALLNLELARPTAGGETVLASLADVLLAHAIRTYLASLSETDTARVGALRDSRIAKAIRLVLADPAHGWTVEELAAEVAMSRSAFASRFRKLAGEPPMRYVTACRLARAASYLAEDGLVLFDIARRTGYDSEASFTRAFSRTYGMAPGAYRRRLGQPLASRPIPGQLRVGGRPDA
jgi:AraC-like DNA-binding protein